MTPPLTPLQARDYVLNSRGSLTARQVADEIGWSRARAATLIDGMLEEGLIGLVRDEPPANDVFPIVYRDPAGAPTKLPEGERGWHEAARWLNEWGIPVVIERRYGHRSVTLDGRPSDVALVCARYSEERVRRLRQ